MTPRQLRSFGVGCGLWILTGLLHMVGHFMGWPDPVNEEQATLFTLFQTYEMDVGGTLRTLSEVFDGLSLAFAVFLFLAGFAGLLWLRVPDVPPGILRRAAGMNAVAALALILVGLPRFPLLPVLCFGAVFLAFLFAAGGRMSAFSRGVDAGTA